jgi:hypothetical protein
VLNLLHHRKAKHLPQVVLSSPTPVSGQPWSRNNKTQQFHHLQQHGFENIEYRVYFRKSYPSKKRLSRICWPLGIKVKLIKIHRLFLQKRLQ